jgi:hypothetical protein
MRYEFGGFKFLAVPDALDIAIEYIVIEPIGITLKDYLIHGEDALFEGFGDGIPFFFHAKAVEHFQLICRIIIFEVVDDVFVASYAVFTYCHCNSFAYFLISKHHNLAMHLGIKVVHNVAQFFGMKSFEAGSVSKVGVNWSQPDEEKG